MAITRALHQGEESLLELTKQVCCFLQVRLCNILTFKWVSLPALSPLFTPHVCIWQNAPDQFTSEEFPVTESKVSMDVSFPGAAFVIVSCKESQLGCRKE